MQPRVTTVGPLVAASATKIGLAQSPAAAGALALNGAAGSFTANNICLSQSVAAAGPLLLNGALASGSPAVAWLPKPPSAIYLTSAGNDSSITFTVIGLDINNVSQTEILHGTNASVVASAKVYSRIVSITASGATASTVTVGAMGVAALDMARQVILTSSADDSGITFTLYGKNWAGDSISETLAGANAGAATSILDYKTLTKVTISAASAGTVSVGTNTVAGSSWINLDPWALGTVSGQCTITGVVNYTVQITDNDPSSYADSVSPVDIVWDSTAVGLIGAVASSAFGISYAPLWIRVLLNSGSGSVRLTAVQHGNTTY